MPASGVASRDAAGVAVGMGGDGGRFSSVKASAGEAEGARLSRSVPVSTSTPPLFESGTLLGNAWHATSSATAGSERRRPVTPYYPTPRRAGSPLPARSPGTRRDHPEREK